MRRLFTYIKGGISFILCCSWTMGFMVLLLPFTFLPATVRYDNRIYFFLTQFYTRVLIFFTFMSIDIKGRENLPEYPKNPSIILMNHTSFLDIPIIEMLFPGYPHVWVSNDYSKVPLFGFMLRRMNVLVQRKKKNIMLGVIKQAYRLTHNKLRHLFIFPEGTRYRDGNIHDFHKGFALLVEKLDRPVIPIAVWGLHKNFPKKSIIVDSSASNVKIRIGEPISHKNFASRQDFICYVQAWFEQEIEHIKNQQ